MNPLSRTRVLALLAALAVAAPGYAGAGEQPVSVDQLSHYTDPQFAKLAASAHGDQKKLRAIEMTKTLFDQAMGNRKKVPATAQFAMKDVRKVGVNVGRILDVVFQYEQAVAAANIVRRTDPVKADLMVRTARMNVLTVANHVSAAMPMLPPKPTVNAVGQAGTESGRGLTNAGVDLMLPGGNTPDRRGPATTIPPASPAVNIGVIATDAAKTARDKVEGLGDNGGNSNGIPPGPPPAPTDTPVPSGTGATSNGTGGGASSAPQTIGQILGLDDPNSPADAMSDARERYRYGDVEGGMADATRAIELGGGAEAYALRGGMQLDQKNFPAAHSDAGQALQLDASNQEALAVLHFSEPRIAVAAPKSLSFGGSADAGGAFGSAAGSGASRSVPVLANEAQPQLSAADLRREIMNALRLNDLGSALAYANRALALEPNNPALLNIRASIEARIRDYAKAAADAAAGLALAPHNAALLRTQSYALLRGGKYKDALASANELIALDPKDAYAYGLRAHAYGSMGDRDAMMADLGRAAALDPRFAKAQAQMAGELQLPADKDMLFLFPGEEAAPAKTPAPAPGRGKSFGLLVGASVLGGLLLALGLLQTVLAPLKDKVTSVFTRITGGSAASAAAAHDTSQPASVNGLLPGLIRGQYEISRQIGMGGMGMVFAGVDRSLGRRVAIKKMREELRINPAERARFVIEAKTVAALHHPNIVDIYAIAEDGQDVYLIFEYVDGKTVHDLVQASGRMPLPDAARVVRAAADALGYAHAHGVVHRDMKPSNVMIDASGLVKVMDFGIARLAKDSATRFSMTNTVVGTPPYMAPEQEQGHVRRESDVYALAVCAYEMLTSKLPFAGIGAGMLMNKINMSYVPPSRAIAGLPEPLDEVFVRAFQADPDKRYRTPKELADALEGALPSGVRA